MAETPSTVDYRIAPAHTPAEVEAVRGLIREYADLLGRDLSFQGFAGELAGLPGDFAPPRGCLLLATVARKSAGCVALRPWEGSCAEMKRLYVRPAYRSLGLGAALAEAAVAWARAAGYGSIRLDTLPEMAAAQGLYARLGFRPIPPYYESPIAGTQFMELTLDPPQSAAPAVTQPG